MFYKFGFIVIFLLIFSLPIHSQEAGETSLPVFCQEYQMQIDFVRGRILQLAEAFPQDKYTWRPADGIRSVSEVYRHIAMANYNLAKMRGIELPANVNLGDDRDAWEKQTTDKKEIAADLQNSFKAVSDMVKKTSEEDLAETVKVFGMEMSLRNFMMTMLGHMHEHHGQLIAYARTNGVVPPWSAPPPPADLKME